MLYFCSPSVDLNKFFFNQPPTSLLIHLIQVLNQLITECYIFDLQVQRRLINTTRLSFQECSFFWEISYLSCMYMAFVLLDPISSKMSSQFNTANTNEEPEKRKGRYRSLSHHVLILFYYPYSVSLVHLCDLPSECLGNCICTNIELICTEVTLIWIWLKTYTFLKTLL